MVDGGPPAPQPPLIVPMYPHRTSSPSCISGCNTSTTRPPLPQLNWLIFLFASKQDEDVETHPLRTNDWMNTHVFQEGVKVQRFCLKLVEVRLLYESPRPIAVDWDGLQAKFGNNIQE